MDAFFRIQPGLVVWTKSRTYNVYYRSRVVLLQGHAIWPIKYQSYILEVSEHGVRRPYWKEGRSLYR